MISRVLHGDFIELGQKLPDNTFDAIITDPPYPKEYAPLWPALGELAQRVLKPGGSLLAITPHYLLPWVLTQIPLKYRWLISMWQSDGAHPRMAMGVEVCWKPVVWWVKGSWPHGRGFVRDGFPNDPPAKGHHKWEQSLSWADAMLKFVPTGGLVLDPMTGSGTVGVACKAAGYGFVGIDNDIEAVKIARQRLDLLTP